MKTDATETLSALLFWILTGAFVLNLAGLLLLPPFLSLRFNAEWADPFRGAFRLSFFPLDRNQWPEFFWRLTFYEVCGACAAVILWQARAVLKNLAALRLFVLENARRVSTAALCLFVISASALVRLCIEWSTHGLYQILTTYNTLFIPVFFVAGLLCRVMARLFEQAARLKDDNDLVI
ncbi:MAG: DUF2975 domain-containing protein [Oscillospiraceae bacterium]|jgi:hypothetical protein|nr:DUF2975 domain-containing protein [Oscillospiraceae bacterium]